MKCLLPIIDTHAFVKNWLLELLKLHGLMRNWKNGMVERDGAKIMANNSVCTSDWLTCWKLSNYVTKLNKKKNQLYYEAKINNRKNDRKKNSLSILNEIMGRITNSTPSFI
jgi:hypothetical protein